MQDRLSLIGSRLKRFTSAAAVLWLIVPLQAVASASSSCPTPSAPMAAVRTDSSVVGNYRDVLTANHCIDLRCRHIGFEVFAAELDMILFDRSRLPVSQSTVEFALANRPTSQTLLAAEQNVKAQRFRKAFLMYLNDFESNVSGVRTLYLDDNGGSERVQSLLEQLGRRPATSSDARSFVEVADQHPNEFAPLLYLGAVLLELNCKAQALHVYRAIPYVRPVVKSTYSGVSTTAMRLALSIDPNAWRLSPANQPSLKSSLPSGL